MAGYAISHSLPHQSKGIEPAAEVKYTMTLDDLVKRTQSLLDDPLGTYVDSDYVEGFANHEYEKLFNKLRLSGNEFDANIVELFAVPAGSINLDTYQATGQQLASMIVPQQLEWKLPGTDASNYRLADGPLDAVRDLAPGIAQLDSWAWIRRSLKLSNFSTALDMRVTGEFLFDPLNDPQAQIQIDLTANVVLTCQVAAAIAKARGNQTWVEQYSQDAIDAFDDLFAVLVRADQGKTRRVGRISRRTTGINPTTLSH